ncbi:MAG: hypothetical protein ACRD47_03325, partial [Nitrososphaeraceae archaeon]
YTLFWKVATAGLPASLLNSMLFPNEFPPSVLLLANILSFDSTQVAKTVSIDDDKDGVGCCAALIDVIVEVSRRIVNTEKVIMFSPTTEPKTMLKHNFQCGFSKLLVLLLSIKSDVSSSRRYLIEVNLRFERYKNNSKV